MKQKVLIVGGTGFLGRRLSARLEKLYAVVVASRSESGAGVVTYDSVANLLEQLSAYKLFAVINCAVLYDRLNQNVSEAFQVNVQLPLELARYAQKTGVSLFISCDSFYRRFNIGVANNHYVLQKKQLYYKLVGLPKSSKTSIVVAVIHHMYGPGDSSEKIINRVIETLERGGEITLSACQQHRYFIDVDDVVEHFVEILANSKKMKTFDEIDIAGDNYLSTKEFLYDLSTVIKKGRLSFDSNIMLPLDKNTVMKNPLPPWFIFNQKDLSVSIEQLL